jgi:hypothetical protein
MEGAWGRLRGVALQPGAYDGYLGVAVEMAGDGCEHKFQFQRALTTEVEVWQEQQLGAESS